jgi:hypothetical protein
MEPAHSETGDRRVEPSASILVARLSMSHLVPLLEFNHSKRYAECLACSSAGLIFPEAMGLQSAIKVEGY